MTNEELVIKIQNGESHLIAELWEQVKGIIYRRVSREMIFDSKKNRAATIGVTKEDLYQEGYFALVDAINYYAPEKGYKFVTYLSFAVTNSVRNALHMRTVSQWKDPTYNAISLDVPVSFGAEESLIDFIPDNENAFETIIEKDYLEQRKRDIRESIRALTPIQRRIILSKYYLLKSQSEIGKTEGISGQSVANIEMAEAIKKEKAAKEEIDEYINRAKTETTLSPFSLSIIELRYFSALEWPNVAAALYSTAWSNATKTEKASYINRIFKQHSRTLSVIEKHMPL